MSPITTFCIVADVHAGRGALGYLPTIVERINALPIGPDFVMSLGDDLYHEADNQALANAEAIESCYGRLRVPHYQTLGNHECRAAELGLLDWADLLRAWHMPGRWYSFDLRGLHVCVLDSWLALAAPEHRADLDAQIAWLAHDLARPHQCTVIFTHEALGFRQADLPCWVAQDNRGFWPQGNPFERVIEAHAGQIAGVFAGHKHRAHCKQADGVTYHLMGPSHRHGGQFAQVFIDTECGGFHVQALPWVRPQSAAHDVQQSYGDPDLIRQCAPCRIGPA